MKNFLKLMVIAAALSGLVGCSTEEIPQASKGRMFERTGAWAFYAGGKGFTGPILGPGTHYTGLYNELRIVDCSEKTEKESLTALTKDGVQFSLDIYTRFSAACVDDKSVEEILTKLSPAPDDKGRSVDTIYADQLYTTFLRPALGEAVREAVSPYLANDVNTKRDEIFELIKKKFSDFVNKPGEVKVVSVNSLNLSNLNFPDEMVHANTDRAVQGVLKDKAIAEREKVTAEIETSKMKQQLAQADANLEVAKIDAVGAALHRNPEYYLRDVYYYAGEKGNMVIMPNDPNAFWLMSSREKK